MDDRCAIRGCRAEADMSYFGHGICANHWDRLTTDDQPVDASLRAIGIPAADAATEENPMSDPKKSVVKSKKTAKAKSAEEAKPKPERKPKEENLVVFAFRLAPEERDAIHAAAGPGGASRFVRAVALAAAREDDAAYRAVLKEARDTR